MAHNRRFNNYNLDITQRPLSAEKLYGFPMVKATQIVPKEIMPFNFALSQKKQSKAYVHFFVDDYQFERVWNTPQRYLEVFRRFKGIIMPDFSLYIDMPRAMQIWNTYRNHWLAAYYSARGIKVIPSVVWGDADSFDFCFLGLPHHSTIVVTTNGVARNNVVKHLFAVGYVRMVKTLKPSNVIVVGRDVVPKIEGVPVSFLQSYSQIRKSVL
jgi:hypothetical protein